MPRGSICDISHRKRQNMLNNLYLENSGLVLKSPNRKIDYNFMLLT